MARRFSARPAAITVASAVAVLALAATSQLLPSNSGKKSAALQQVLDLPQQPFQLRLFSGGVDTSGKPLVPGERAVEMLREDRTGVDKRYQINKDRSTVNVQLQPDGRHQAQSQVFYPTASDDDGRHLQALTNYQGDKEKVVAQDIRRKDGTRLRSTHVSNDGAKSIVSYAEDGNTVIDETLFDPPPLCCGEALVKSQHSWLADAQHSLVYADVTASDGIRTKTKFDDKHQILWTMKCAQKQCYSNGTTVRGYYADTHNVRFESESDYSVDKAKYYRQDGTLWYELKITSSSNAITFYDATGKKPVLEQDFFRKDETDSDQAVKITANSVYTISEITEFDADGNATNTFDFLGDEIDHFAAKNITLDGVFYKEINLYFNQGGELNWGVLLPDGPGSRISVNHSNYTPPPLPRPSPDELKLSIPLFGDDLPVPPPQRFE
ncbi:MAG: hypothetical protein P4L53_23910 [Candidatus Obscuribacterales bacterium]|nr:hypothetical protein [Candidatus Obscuribacterales bacterium]